MRKKLPFFAWLADDNGYGWHVVCFLFNAVWIIGFAWAWKTTEMENLQRKYFDVIGCVSGQQAQPPEPLQQCMETVYDITQGELDMANGWPQRLTQPSK